MVTVCRVRCWQGGGVMAPEHSTGAAMIREIAESLHGMCQPLTALQCRLEMGQMSGTAVGYEEAVVEALRESERLLLSVSTMREMVRQALEQS